MSIYDATEMLIHRLYEREVNCVTFKSTIDLFNKVLINLEDDPSYLSDRLRAIVDNYINKLEDFQEEWNQVMRVSEDTCNEEAEAESIPTHVQINEYANSFLKEVEMNREDNIEDFKIKVFQYFGESRFDHLTFMNIAHRAYELFNS